MASKCCNYGNPIAFVILKHIGRADLGNWSRVSTFFNDGARDKIEELKKTLTEQKQEWCVIAGRVGFELEM